MKEEMRSERRWIYTGLIFACLLTVLAFVSVGCAADTYTVCPSGCDYTSIEAAIGTAQPGDTIEVHSGTYYENVNVYKQLILRGIETGGGKPVVDAGGFGSAITLSHDGIVLDGFTAIKDGCHPSTHRIVGILVYSNNNIVINNTALNNGEGIVLCFASNNTLIGNVNSNNCLGIALDSSSNNTLTGNTVSNNDYGIRLDSSNINNISGNTANSNNYDGIYMQFSSNNTLTGNSVSNKYNGILLYSSSDNYIYNNYFNNSNNVRDNGNNIWNISKTPGTNIIGGSWLGGNYWSDYAGKDTNGDGLGNTLLPYNSSGNITNGGDWLPLVPLFDTGEGTYLSISGTFNGTITPSRNLTVSTLYTYPCSGTGGHTKSIELYENETLLASGEWDGYLGDWHSISLNNSITLYANKTYSCTIVTGSYPQIVHAENKDVTGGRITCEEFVDVTGKRYKDWIPAIRCVMNRDRNISLLFFF